jgi:hypothetical protein
MSIETLKEKAKTYSISQEYLDSKEKGRLEFVAKFPIDKISELSIDEYVLGTDKESFCYWLEFKKIEDKVILFGIGGGNASKFGLYKSKDGIYQLGFGENKKSLNGKELENYFSKIKNTIILAIKYVSENRISEIKKMDIPFGNMILQKILSIYYPEKFITIGSSSVLIDLAKYINLQNIELNPNNLIEINYECKKVIDSIPEFKNWSYDKIGTFIWNYFEGEIKKDKINYYLVGAYWDGRNPADQTTRFMENGIWENGYDDKFTDEVNAVPVGSKIAIKAAFTREKTKSVMAIKAIGTVLENLNDGQKLIVEWDDNFNPFEVDFSGGYWATIKEVKNKDHINAIFYGDTIGKTNFEVKNNIGMNNPLNTILYGPPGTGKTFNSIDKAVAIATGSSSNNISNKKKFDELRKQGQIEFVTFHQNYSYEDFMVGIRPNVSETTSELSFKKHYGIFYEIAKRAKENYENSLKDEQTISRENWVNEKFEEFKEYVESEIEENGKFAVKNNVSIYAVEEEVFIYTGEKENGELWKNQRIGMHYDALINIYLSDVQNRQDIKKLENVPSLEKQHATYSFELIEKFREFLTVKGYKFQSTNVQKEPLKNFVLIIDEINRANISKVFGELITLLEDDKRIGKPNELKITLPNGEKEFGVPPNLYIIGTMNTADKSIALIDIALRRRFEFLGYYPDYENEKLKLEAKILLQKINEEIYKLKNSADYLIGHAYFMKDEEIETTLRNKVVPLLMEYFSGKTDIVSKIFNETSWQAEYNINTFDWLISPR